MISPNLRSLTNDSGQTMTEYAFILALVIALVIVVVPTLGAATMKLYTDFTNAAFGS